ncbi:recombinase family protein [Sphingobacterium olei]|uniref:Recombinase family protein n=1 Tax=Sphingobacterium olei TaxID=2571155 RepID=A0A4U0NJ04_9SPHI|nr:recombinase family protein [Sphingobacterium olei]TJZ53682.1 recombinase family protein [Sphingobacterium olei]
MNSAYLYVRVSTDEQKRKGFSLIEQEDRLLKYCEMNQIKVRGIFREDFSAKDFNRPEWKRLIKTIKRSKHHSQENILFIKWDRFSRSIEYAYQMMGILRGLNTQAMAIDQPIDFEVPESIVMLAVYLSIPEAENNRRGKNTSDGMRRARKMGRWPAKAPIGYMNQVASDGKKITIPKQPEADYIRWSFTEYSSGKFTISHVRRMANLRGLRCSRNNFWKALHNPFYCGLVSVPATRTEEEEFVEGIHEPLISEQLFREVQSLINSRRTRNTYKQKMKPVFLLRGYLICPLCGRRLTGSISTGRNAKYRYYHCSVSKCKGCVRADILEGEYEERLKKMTIRPEVNELLELVLEDENILTVERECINEKKNLKEISEQELLISKLRRYFLDDKIELDDFNDLKKEYKEVLDFLNEHLALVNERLISNHTFKNVVELMGWGGNVYELYKNQDVAGKRYIIELFTPTSFNPITKELNPLQINQALSMITSYSGYSVVIDCQATNFATNLNQSLFRSKGFYCAGNKNFKEEWYRDK